MRAGRSAHASPGAAGSCTCSRASNSARGASSSSPGTSKDHRVLRVPPAWQAHPGRQDQRARRESAAPRGCLVALALEAPLVPKARGDRLAPEVQPVRTVREAPPGPRVLPVPRARRGQRDPQGRLVPTERRDPLALPARPVPKAHRAPPGPKVLPVPKAQRGRPGPLARRVPSGRRAQPDRATGTSPARATWPSPCRRT